MLSRARFVLGLAMVFVIATLILMSGSQAQQPTGPESRGMSTGLITSVPRTMTYQGILKDNEGSPLPDSAVDITFKIYNVSTGGEYLWISEPIPCTTDAGGYFDAILGQANPINIAFDEDYWLELEVEGELGPMEPRQKINMVGYSARSDTSDYAFNSLGGGGWVDDGPVVRLETSTDKVGIGTTEPQLPLHVVSHGATHQLRLESTYSGGGRWSIGQSDDGFGCPGGLLVFTPDDEGSVNSVMALSNSGNVGIGMTSPSRKLDVNGAVNATTFYGDGSNLTGIEGGIGGSGTANYIPKFTAPTTIGNSAIYETGDRVGIGTTNPTRDLYVAGEIEASGLIVSSALSTGTLMATGNFFSHGPSVFYDGATFDISTTVNGTSYADKFYVSDAGNHNAISVRNNSGSYPTIWSSAQGDNIAIYGQVGNGNAMKADNSSTSFPSIYTNNSQSNSSQVLGVYAHVATSNDYGIGTNGRGYFGGGILLTSVTTSRGERTMTSPMVPECEIYISGSSNLSLGRADIQINLDMVEIIATSEPLKVIVTPTGMCNGMAVTSKKSNGFTVEELGNGTSNSGFDWLVIARKSVSYTNKTAEEMPLVPRVMESVAVESPID